MAEVVVYRPPLASSQQSQVGAEDSANQQEIALGLGTLYELSGKTQRCFRALAQIGGFLPPDAPACKNARDMVTDQRILLHDVSLEIAGMLGDLWSLERNTCSQLRDMLESEESATSETPMSLRRKNFAVTAENVAAMDETRAKIIQSVQRCHMFGERAATSCDGAKTVQHALMEVVSQYGLDAKTQSLVETLQRKEEAVSKARQVLDSAAQECAVAQGEHESCVIRCATYEAAANDERAGMEAMRDKARRLEDEYANASEEAATTFNKGIRHRFLWVSWLTETSNDGDVARWKAERFRAAAKEISELAGDKSTRVRRAAEGLAAERQKLKASEAMKSAAPVKRAAAEEQLHKCQQSLQVTEKEADDLSNSCGGLTLKHIGQMSQYLQQLPEVMTERGSKNKAVLGMVEGFVKRHKLLENRLQAICGAPTDAECNHVLKMTRSSIKDYFAESTFFSHKLEKLTDRVRRDMEALQDIARAEGAQRLALVPSSNFQALPPPVAKPAVSLAEEDELEF